MASQIKIEGFKELRNRIKKLDTRLQRKVYNRAVKAGGKVLSDEAKSNVPRRTGTLARSVTVRASSKPAKGLFGVKVSVRGGRSSSERTARRRGKGASYKPDAVERYYRFQELGTKYHRAKPFLKPAIESKKAQCLAAIKSELEAGLEREARSL